MTRAEQVWSSALHRLWRSVASITERDELARVVLPPLMVLPGVVAVWGLRHDAAGGYSVYRSEGVPLTGELIAVAERLAAGVPVSECPELRKLGVAEAVVAGFTVAGESAGTFLVLVRDGADRPSVADCLEQVVDATREAVRRLAARRTEEDQLVRDALLAEASLQMDAVLDTTQTMQRVARMAVPAIAEGCLVYVCEDDKPALRSWVHVDMRRLTDGLADGHATTLLERLADDAMGGTAAGLGDGEAELFGARQVEAQVLRARGRVIGVLIFLFDRAADRVPPPLFLRDLAQRAALAIDNGEQYERRRRDVMTMQRHLLPSRLPAVPGFEIAAVYTVGDRVLEVGGDFYDVVVRRTGVVAALIGDVCGRGVDAAAMTGMARHTLGGLLQEGVSPARALDRLNAGLLRDGSWRFVTAGVGMLRLDAAGAVVQWMSCGHPPPIVLRRGREARPGRGGGVPLGVLPRARTGRSRLRLGFGDTLLMFTDGLTESRSADGAMFEDAGLGEALHRLRDAAPQTLVQELSRAAAAFSGEQADDIAVLAIRVREHGDERDD